VLGWANFESWLTFDGVRPVSEVTPFWLIAMMWWPGLYVPHCNLSDGIILQQHFRMPCCRCRLGICVDCVCAMAARTCVDCVTPYCRNISPTTSLCQTCCSSSKSARVHLVQGKEPLQTTVADSVEHVPTTSTATDMDTSQEQGSALLWLHGQA